LHRPTGAASIKGTTVAMKVADPIVTMQKKLINEPDDIVRHSLEGLELSHPHLLRVHYDPHFVCRIDAPVKGKVTLISGSGSGHEPLNTGYVGPGMLDAACPGKIFTSPTPNQYVEALDVAYGGAGALFIIKNYSGAVLNIGMAMDMAREEGYTVESVLVNDDVAIDDPCNRRGMGATVLVEKMAGAAAEAGQPLSEVTAIARQVIDQARSMGIGLEGVTLPTASHPAIILPHDQIELGIGIHGERGRHRSPMTTADQVTEKLIERILNDLPLQAGDKVLALVSGLGGTPIQELYIVFRHLYHLLKARGIIVERRLVGNYITSLNMAGCTITLLRLTPELIDLWDAPVHTPALWW